MLKKIIEKSLLEKIFHWKNHNFVNFLYIFATQI